MGRMAEKDPEGAPGTNRSQARRRARRLPVGLGLCLMATALSGCASMLVQGTLGPAPQPAPAGIVGYQWAARRGDELIVVYEVWGGRPRHAETRWTAIDLPTAAWSPGLQAFHTGIVQDHLDPIPDRGSLEPVLMTELPERTEGTAARAPALHAPVAPDDVAVYARRGRSPELTIVATDGSGRLRSASWAVRLREEPAPAEPLPRALGRAVAVPVAGAVDLVTAPVQLLLGLTGVVQFH